MIKNKSEPINVAVIIEDKLLIIESSLIRAGQAGVGLESLWADHKSAAHGATDTLMPACDGHTLFCLLPDKFIN